MAGLDSEDSPFNGNARDHIQSFQMSFSKSNRFSGDISSNGHVNNSSAYKEQPTNGNVRPKPYLSNSYHDPVMNDSRDQSSYIDNSHDEAQKRRDELYDRILRDTSNAFNRIGEQNVTLNVMADTTDIQADENCMEVSLDACDLNPAQISPEKAPRSKIPRPGAKRGTDSDTDHDRSHLSDKFDNLKGPGGEIIMSLSPFDDDDGGRQSPQQHEVDSPDRGGQTSLVSDLSYRMDSFEQSYVSERGEVVHLGDDVDYSQSSSPIRHHSDNEEF